MRRSRFRSVAPFVALASIVALSSCADSISAPPTRALAVSTRAKLASSWTPVASMLNIRQNLSATTGPDGRIYALGGGLYSFYPNAEVYDPATNSWTGIAAPATAGLGAAATAGGKIFYGGGYLTGWGQSTTLESYNPATNSWSNFSTFSEWRSSFTMVTGPDGKVYSIGGWTYWLISSPMVEAMDPATGVWTTRAPLNLGRTYSVAAVANGKIYAIGGSIISGIAFNPSASVEAYDPATNTWTFVASMPTPRMGHSAVTGPDGRIYVAGGQNCCAFATDVDIYDPGTDTWTTGPALPEGHISGAMAASGSHIYYLGGNAPPSGMATSVVYSLEVAPPPPPTPEEQVTDLGASIAELLASGGLTAGSASSLQTTLAAVQASIASGNTTSAKGQLGAFVNKVKALVKSGRLDAPTAADLNAAAQAVIASLSS